MLELHGPAPCTHQMRVPCKHATTPYHMPSGSNSKTPVIHMYDTDSPQLLLGVLPPERPPDMHCAIANAAALHAPATIKPYNLGRCAACTDPAAEQRDAALVGLRCAACGGAVPPWHQMRAGHCSLHRLPSGLAGGGACRGCGRRMPPGEQVGRMFPGLPSESCPGAVARCCVSRPKLSQRA